MQQQVPVITAQRHWDHVGLFVQRDADVANTGFVNNGTGEVKVLAATLGQPFQPGISTYSHVAGFSRKIKCKNTLWGLRGQVL